MGCGVWVGVGGGWCAGGLMEGAGVGAAGRRGRGAQGAVLAGTSAGASAMGGIMMVRGASRETHRIGDLQMAAGLALLPGLIIDQHFAERGRYGRLMSMVATSPSLMGIGIDEDTLSPSAP